MTLDALWLLAATGACLVGTVWIALAMPVHWAQVRGPALRSRRAGIALRVAGALCQLLSLAICLVVDHASMAALVWIMSLTGAAFVTAMLLSWRPACLWPMVAWLR